MTNILIVSATELEVEGFLKNRQIELVKLLNIKRFFLDNKRIDVLITSVGMVATSYSLTRVLSEITYDYVINMGICGSFNEHLKIAEVVEVVQEIFAEMAVDTAEGLKPFRNTKEANILITQKNLILIPIITPSLNKLKKVRAITVNTVTGTPERKEMLTALYNPDIESMEGAAFVYVCNAFKVPCLQIRSISNKTGYYNKTDWHIEEAIQELTKTVKDIINEI